MAKKPLVSVEEVVPLKDLKNHPRNYKKHPDDQLEHLGASLKEYGQYRRIVTARDHTIIAGHGVAAAMLRVGYKDAKVTRYDLAPDHPKALKLVAIDNETPMAAEVDDRALASLLKDVKDSEGLLGTGYSDLALDRLLATEVDNIRLDPNAEWRKQMPEYEHQDKQPQRQIIVSFANAEDVAAFAKLIGQNITDSTRSLWYPKAEIERMMDKRYERTE